MKNEARSSPVISLDVSVYPLSAIYSAAYVFLDKAYVHLDKGAKTEVLVSLKPKQSNDPVLVEKLHGEFRNELLNCALRESIAKENIKVREYIVGQALYASVQDMQAASSSSGDDPLGIAVPWEEKYSKKKSSSKAITKKKSLTKARAR